MRGFLTVFGVVFVGNMLAERFILKANADDPTGMIPVADGIGLDDAARAGVCAGLYVVARPLIQRFAK